MKVNYDHKPSTMEAVGDGSIRFRYAVTEVTDLHQANEEEAQSDSSGEWSSSPLSTSWQCEEVIVWPPLSSNKVLASAITDRWPQDREQKLVNDYNSAQLDLLEEPMKQQAIQNYTQFLTDRAKLKQEIETLCVAEGIE